MSNPKKAKRRSSLAPARVTIPAHTDREQNLYRDIDESLPDEDRLAIFTKSCFQYTLQKMTEEMDDSTGFRKIRIEAESKISDIVRDLQEKKAFHEACTKLSYLPNPVNCEMDEAITEIEAQAKMLNAEAEQWTDLVSKMEERLEAAEKDREEDGTKLDEDDIPEHVKLQAKLYLCESVDYQSLLADLDNGMAKTALLIDQHVKNVNLLKGVHKKASEIIDKRHEDLSAIIHTESPRKLIENYLSS